jgi:MGT family glycosyltransferase
MLWQPEGVARRLERILSDVRPRRIVVDHLAFGATLALRALGRSYASLLPSHPCQLPRPGDPDGYPVRFPEELAPPAAELAALRALCERRARRFTAAYNRALLALDPSAAPVRDAVSTPAPELTVVAYPAELAPDFERPGVALVGSLVRAETADDELAAALRRRRPGRPAVYVSLGTFLSAREDALATIAAALRRLDADAVISAGVADPAALGPLPPSWHVRAQLPQVAAIAGCDAVICHGGNNTVMEALSAGVPVLAGPFSSDQFVAAEDLRRSGAGDAYAPNQAGAAELAERITRLLDGPARERAAALGRRLSERPGAARAWELIDAAPAPRAGALHRRG